MKIVDAFDVEVTQSFSKMVKIISSDGRALFSIKQNDDGSIDVHCSDIVHIDGVILTEQILLSPVASNWVTISRKKYNV